MELDREDFRLWLAAKEPDEPVGIPGATDACGLASWLRECGWPGAWVCAGKYGIADGRESELPRWAAIWELLYEFGEPLVSDWFERSRPKRVPTAKQALAILDSIEVQ